MLLRFLRRAAICIAFFTTMHVTATASGDARLEPIAEFLDSAATQIDRGTITRTDELSENGRVTSHKVTKNVYDGERLLMQSRRSTDPEEEDWSHAIMLNTRYAAAVMRHDKARIWELRSLAFPGEPEYETMKRSLLYAHPIRSFLRGGQSWIPDELRNGEVIDYEHSQLRGVPVGIWTVKANRTNYRTGAPMGEKTRKYVIRSESPYYLFEYSNDLLPGIHLQKVELDDWALEGDTHVPKSMRILLAMKEGDPLLEAGSFSWQIESDLVGFDPDALFLGYYGLPEPDDQPGISSYLKIGAVGVLLLVIGGFFVRRQRLANG